MKLAMRLSKLEQFMQKNTSNNGWFSEKEYQAFEDWSMKEPKANELLKRLDDYCDAKGYPKYDLDFFDELDDQVFWKMAEETLTTFDDYKNKVVNAQ